MYKFMTNKNIKHSVRILCSRQNLQFFSDLRSKSSNVEQLINKNVPLIQRAEKLFNNDSNNRRIRNSIAERLVNKSSVSIQPYLKIMRINKPIGSWLLFWPCGWGIALAAAPGFFPDLHLLTLFGAGALVMRGAGCTINDMWDRDIDSKVARTIDRPLVNGSMSIQQAWIFLASQLSVGLMILLQLNWYSVCLGASSLGLVIMYPLMKRVTHWPQLILGMAFNWGILLGYSAVHGFVDWSVCAPMYISAICWTIIYDTIYAYQDVTDDILHGIQSTAIKFQQNAKYWLTGFSTVMITGLTFTGIMADQTWPYYSAVALAASHLLWQIYDINVMNPKDCASKFISNHHVGFILFLGIIFGNLLKTQTSKSESKNIGQLFKT